MALPDYSTNGFYDPTNPYTGVNTAKLPSGMANYYGTDVDPRAAFETRLTQAGLGGTGSRARAAQGLFPRVQQGYGQAKMNKNFELFFPEYLDTLNMGRMMGSMSHDAQGLNDSQYSGRYRWGMRS